MFYLFETLFKGFLFAFKDVFMLNIIILIKIEK